MALVLHRKRPNAPTVANGTKVSVGETTASLATLTTTTTTMQMMTANAPIVARAGILKINVGRKRKGYLKAAQMEKP